MKKIKAEVYDKLYYMMKRGYFDGTVRGYLSISGVIDQKVFTEVVKKILDTYPILHSYFHYQLIMPYWEVYDYQIDNILSFVSCDNPDEEGMKAILESLDENNRIKIYVFSNDQSSNLVILVDHACLDGIDFQYLVKMLLKNYHHFKMGEKDLVMKDGPRGMKEIYRDFSLINRMKAKNLITYPKYYNDHYFPWTDDEEEDTNQMVRVKVFKEDFLRLKKYLEKKKATINDALITALIASLYEMLDCKDQPISIANVVDLRRYIKDSNTTGLTNYSSLIGITVPKDQNIHSLLDEVVSITKKEKNKKFMGLNGLPLLSLAFHFLPFAVALPIVEKNYVDAKISLSNMGCLLENDFSEFDLKIKDYFMTGTTKYKPYFLMSVSTFQEEMSLSSSIKGNEKDKKVMKDFLERVVYYLKELEK